MNPRGRDGEASLSGFGMLSFYFDRLRLDDVSVVGFLADWLSSFTLFLVL
jgi:hypothetical protein